MVQNNTGRDTGWLGIILAAIAAAVCAAIDAIWKDDEAE